MENDWPVIFQLQVLKNRLLLRWLKIPRTPGALARRHPSYAGDPPAPTSAPLLIAKSFMRNVRRSKLAPTKLPHVLAEGLHETLSYKSELPPAPTVFLQEALSEGQVMKVGSHRLPPAPTPAPALFAGSLKQNPKLWSPPRLLFILLN